MERVAPGAREKPSVLLNIPLPYHLITGLSLSAATQNPSGSSFWSSFWQIFTGNWKGQKLANGRKEAAVSFPELPLALGLLVKLLFVSFIGVFLPSAFYKSNLWISDCQIPRKLRNSDLFAFAAML